MQSWCSVSTSTTDAFMSTVQTREASDAFCSVQFKLSKATDEGIRNKKKLKKCCLKGANVWLAS